MPLTRDYYGAESYGQHRMRDFDDIFREWYDPRRNMTRVRMLNGDKASVEDALDMIEILIRIHQAHFQVSRENKWILHFPYMLIEPEVGDKILNLSTEEVYTITHLGRDPRYQSWDRTAKLSGYTAPALHERLSIIDDDKTINFSLEYPMKPAKDSVGTEGATGFAESEPWRPTITARLRRKEPASIGKHPFGEQKVLKPQLWEIFRNPDPNLRELESIEVYRQPFDNMIQFDCFDVNPLGALRTAAWFEQFMRTHIGTLKRHGLSEILFWDQRDTEAREQWREGIVGQSVRYFFRTETLSVVRRSNLTELSLHIRVVKNPLGLSGGHPSGETWWLGRVHNSSGDYLYGTFDIEDHAWADPATLVSNTGDPFDGVTGQLETRP